MEKTGLVNFIQNLWPFAYLIKLDDLAASDKLVRKLSLPENTKQFIYAAKDPDSGSIIYILCVQNLSERSALDTELLVREIKPDAVIAQVTYSINDENDSVTNVKSGGCGSDIGDEEGVPTSSFEVLRRCFLHKINKDRYENVAGSLVLREIFGVGFNGHFAVAKKAAEEVGASFLLLESPLVECRKQEDGESDGAGFKGGLSLQASNLVPQRAAGSAVPIVSSMRSFCIPSDIHFQMVKSLSAHLVSSGLDAKSAEVQPSVDYEAPQFAQWVYPLLVDLHDIFGDICSIGRALACAQRMFYDINKGESVDSKLLSEVYIFRIAVEGLRIALNNAGRLPVNRKGNQISSDKTDFSKLPTEEKSYAILAQTLQSQTKKFKSIVAVIDASSLAGLRKHWSTPVPAMVKDMVEQLISDYERDCKLANYGDRKRLLTDRPVVAVGAGATAVLGASSLSKVVPASTFMKIVSFKVPASLKLVMTQTQKAIAIALGKTKVVAPGMATSGLNGSAWKVTASAEKIRAVAHSVIASAEKTSLSAMRTAFYEIMRKRRVRPVGFLPWATFGCSIATCTSLLVYGDGIECVAESLPSAPSIASLGRGIQSLHQASEAARNAESSRMQKSIESLLYRFKKIKVQ